jgi:hypothetical protein
MTMRKDIEYGRGMAVPVARKLDREGKLMSDSDATADEEIKLALGTLHRLLAEKGIDSGSSLAALVETWWLNGYKEGYRRGLSRGVNETQRVALDAIKAEQCE